ncbi:signal transduction histidine kinase [Streptomyces griseochromogenes]|uniref:histidine kinase n=1 Tax=Streptomyces griseochromogenes TaxID=68214 RepID=A0A1B1AQT3_9ACTN|nr:sensor histidine kinase [Streptomyces griseochromogenes]ANP48924.1 histidine kinase [Streptomyces griseochromogenes]MBP2049578.1 signal transduction histidine kinase [Streptomyces griseochromogenes]
MSPAAALARGWTGRGRWVALGRCQVLGLAGFLVVGAGMLVGGALALLPVGVGFRLLPPAAGLLRRLSDRYRARAARWTGRPLSPPDPLPHGTSARRGGAAILGDDGFWHDLRWAWLEPWTGGLLAALPLALVEYGAFGALVQPFVWRRLGDGNWYAFVPVTSTATMVTALLLGLALIAVGLRLAPVMTTLHARLTHRLLSAPRTIELTRRVARLTDTRAAAQDVHAAELTRIERDLHDGAQARLVALGLTLDEATRLLETDPGRARTLLLDVRAASERALQDLRDLVHGVLPPVLADRGLADAVRSLALDSHLDVEVAVDLPPGRLPSPVESAAYFAVSELLTNAAKHADATRVDIALTHDGTRLRASVTDDGHGGADASAGTGLLGVRRRLDTFDGTLALHSPPGGPTTATLEIPCASSSPKTSSSCATA